MTLITVRINPMSLPDAARLQAHLASVLIVYGAGVATGADNTTLFFESIEPVRARTVLQDALDQAGIVGTVQIA